MKFKTVAKIQRLGSDVVRKIKRSGDLDEGPRSPKSGSVDLRQRVVEAPASASVEERATQRGREEAITEKIRSEEMQATRSSIRREALDLDEVEKNLSDGFSNIIDNKQKEAAAGKSAAAAVVLQSASRGKLGRQTSALRKEAEAALLAAYPSWFGPMDEDKLRAAIAAAKATGVKPSLIAPAEEVAEKLAAKATEATEAAAAKAAEDAAKAEAEAEASKVAAAERALRAGMPGFFAQADAEKLRAALPAARECGVKDSLLAAAEAALAKAEAQAAKTASAAPADAPAEAAAAKEAESKAEEEVAAASAAAEAAAKAAMEAELRAAMPGFFAKADVEKLRAALPAAKAAGVKPSLIEAAEAALAKAAAPAKEEAAASQTEEEAAAAAAKAKAAEEAAAAKAAAKAAEAALRAAMPGWFAKADPKVLSPALSQARACGVDDSLIAAGHAALEQVDAAAAKAEEEAAAKAAAKAAADWAAKHAAVAKEAQANLRAAMPGWLAKAEPKKLRLALSAAKAAGIDDWALIAAAETTLEKAEAEAAAAKAAADAKAAEEAAAAAAAKKAAAKKAEAEAAATKAAIVLQSGARGKLGRLQRRLRRAARQAAATKAAANDLRAAMPGWFAKADPRTLRDALAKARACGVDDSLLVAAETALHTAAVAAAKAAGAAATKELTKAAPAKPEGPAAAPASPAAAAPAAAAPAAAGDPVAEAESRLLGKLVVPGNVTDIVKAIESPKSEASADYLGEELAVEELGGEEAVLGKKGKRSKYAAWLWALLWTCIAVLWLKDLYASSPKDLAPKKLMAENTSFWNKQGHAAKKAVDAPETRSYYEMLTGGAGTRVGGYKITA